MELAHRGVKIGERDDFFAPQHINGGIREREFLRTPDAKVALVLEAFNRSSVFGLLDVVG